MKLNIKNRATSAFTIIELIIVITVIAILATVTIVAYNGIQDNAHKATLMSDLDNATSTLELSYKQNGSYPASVAVADNGNPLSASTGTTYTQYIVGTNTSSPTYCLTATNSGQRYTISQDGSSVAGSCNLLQNSSTEKTGGNEFLQYADLAPIFGQYGLVPYTPRYNFGWISVPVSTSYTRQSITVTPVLSDATLTQSILSFYGTYGTGNISTVKNVKVSLGSTTNSAWTPAP